MTETPRDPFAPDPTPNPAPDPVPPPHDPSPLEPPTPVDPPEPPPPFEPPTPVDPPEPAEPVEPVTPPDPVTPPQPITPEPISPPDPVDPPAPLEVPLPLGSRAEEPPPAYENAGDPRASAEDPAPVEAPQVPQTPEAPQAPQAPEPDPGPDPAAPVELPLPLGSRAEEPPLAYENAGDPAVLAPDEPAPVAPAPDEPAPVAPAPDEPALVVPAPTPGGKRTWLPVAAVGLAVLLLAGATGWLGWQVRQQSVAEEGRPDAVAAARDAARLLFSYDHASLEEDFAKGLAVTTGEFRSEYSRTTKEVVTPVAQQYKAVVVAEVVEASIVEDGPGRATALVFLNQGTTSTRVQGQQVDQSRVRMQLVERDGRWLVRAVDAL